MPERVETSLYFCAVIQTDFKNQMDVYRYLVKSSVYKCICITHDKDRYLQDYSRTDEHGVTHDYKTGDLCVPHIHMIIRCPKRISADTLTKRFGAYVNFQICYDPYEYALYFTHDTFQAIRDGKTRYPKDAIFGDSDLMNKYVRLPCQNSSDCVQEFYSAFMRGGSCQSAISILISEGAHKTINDVKSHAYFYHRFVCGE